jgi:hypothetical protein
MCPRLLFDDTNDGYRADAELDCQIRHAHPVGKVVSNHGDLVSGELRQRAILSQGAIASLGIPVCHVGGMGAEPQVGDLDAAGVVAGVANLHSGRDWSVNVNPDRLMRVQPPSVKQHWPVAPGIVQRADMQAAARHSLTAGEDARDGHFVPFFVRRSK